LSFDRTGIGPGGKVQGQFRATGIRPKCSERIAAAGMPLRADMFEHVKVVALRRECRDLCRCTFVVILGLVLGAYWLFVLRFEQVGGNGAAETPSARAGLRRAQGRAASQAGRATEQRRPT
jgi:hypothetical protein